MEGNKLGEYFKKLLPYIIPAVILLAVISIFVIPLKPQIKVFEQPKLEAVGNVCSRLYNTTFVNGTAQLGDMYLKKVGLVTNPNYDIYLGIEKTGLGYSIINIIRCDKEGAFFPVRCYIKSLEGDKVSVDFTEAQEMFSIIYKGYAPDAVTAQCFAVKALS